MANFKIIVEPLNKDVEVAEELLNGLECDGYFLVGHSELTATESSDTVSLNEINRLDMAIAIAIAKSDDLLEAAMIARGIEEGRLMRKNRKKPNASDLLAAMLKD